MNPLAYFASGDWTKYPASMEVPEPENECQGRTSAMNAGTLLLMLVVVAFAGIALLT